MSEQPKSDRTSVAVQSSKGWTRRRLRAVQCILRVTHGVVGPKKPYFEFAFGKDVDEFLKILDMTEDEICGRGRDGR